METTDRAVIQSYWADHIRKVRILAVPDDYAPGEPDLRAVLIPKIRALLEELDAPCSRAGNP